MLQTTFTCNNTRLCSELLLPKKNVHVIIEGCAANVFHISHAIEIKHMLSTLSVDVLDTISYPLI